MRIVDTSGWPFDELAVYLPDVIEAMGRLEGKLPDEERAEYRVGRIVSGEDRLWIIFDGEEAAFAVLTSINTSKATGHRFVAVTGMAAMGKARSGMAEARRLIEATACIAGIEEFAASRGIGEVVVNGRGGWVRLLKKRGYGVKTVVLGKSVGANNG